MAAADELSPLPPLPVAELVDGHDPQPAPEGPGDADNRSKVLDALTGADETGLSAAEIRAATEINRTSLYRVLRQLTDAGTARQTGGKGRFRYHPAPVG